MGRIVRIVLGILIVAGGVATVRGITSQKTSVRQPISFSHAVHVDDAGMACTDCHLDALRARYAGLPGKELCFDCHDPDDEADANTEKAKLISFADTDGDIPWRRVTATAPDVFFSHRRHTAVAGMDCLECHKDRPAWTAPPETRRLVMTMNDCIQCHEERKASVDCLACHR